TGPANGNAAPGGFVPQFPGQQFPGQAPPPGVTPGAPNNNNNQSFQPQFPGQQFPGQAPPPGVNVNPTPGAPGQTQPPPGFQFGPNGTLVPITQNPQTGGGGTGTPSTPGVPGGGQVNAGLGLIQQILTTPRQPPPTVNAPQAQGGGGGGIAGVASTH